MKTRTENLLMQRFVNMNEKHDGKGLSAQVHKVMCSLLEHKGLYPQMAQTNESGLCPSIKLLSQNLTYSQL